MYCFKIVARLTHNSNKLSSILSPVSIERHLILQELTLRPSGEWTPRHHEWFMVRVAEGVGYWLQPGVAARPLGVGDGLLTSGNSNGVLRASQLGVLKLQFFLVQAQYLNGLLTVAEWHQLEVAPNNPSARVSIFTAAEPLAQRFTRLAEQPHKEGLPVRCGLLQLWANAIANLLPAPVWEPAGSGKLLERFRQLVGRMPEAELSQCSLRDLAGQLNCSERHFTRLFREEFGVPFRARQIELRLQHARQLLADSDAKIINVAYDSGYQHLGLFNMMFKKRFRMTPSEWRQQSFRKSPPAPSRSHFPKPATRTGILLALFVLNFISTVFAQTGSTVAPGNGSQTAPAGYKAMALARDALFLKMIEMDAREEDTRMHVISTNAGPRFAVNKYLVTGNSALSPEAVARAITNVDGAFGTNTSFEGIRAALTELQGAYRERGFVTVSVGLPRQKLTNGMVNVQVTEGRLAAINVTGNHYFSSNNVMCALPGLHTNLLLNSHVLQGELDAANASRNRQIYPVIGPGPEPGTSELTLKVKDQLPLHARLELNNQGTPGTPELRANLNAQYDNLWDLEHQVGLQYGFTPDQFKNSNPYNASPFDDPLIANYSGYYRLPLGGYNSVQEQVDANPGSFGYSEITHQFQMPPPTGRPELTVYASRSTSDTGVQLGSPTIVSASPLLSLGHRAAGENVTLNQGLGFKFSLPLPALNKVVSRLTFGMDVKHYQAGSANADIFYELISTTNNGSAVKFGHVLQTIQQPVRQTEVDYFPLNVGWSGSIPDSLGTTFFNSQANFNVLQICSEENHQVTTTNIIGTNIVTSTSTEIIHDHSFSSVAYTTNAHPHYVTLQMGADRIQTVYKDWSVKLHADGQWADGPLFSNEQFAMGGTAGVRGYQDGQAYGDTGWRFSIEPQTPLFNIGRVGNEGHEEPCWVRGSVFLDYGRIYLLAQPPPGGSSHQSFCGAGWAMTANIGSHVDGRVTVAWPLIGHAGEPAGVHIYFGLGAQF
jgi:hemolysin activation/secretion protein/AraC-like DNA-binding protein